MREPGHICLRLRKSAPGGVGLRSTRIDLTDRAGQAFIRPGGPPIFANLPCPRENAGRGQIKRRKEFRLANAAVLRGEIEMAGERLSGGDEQNAEKNFDWRVWPSAEGR